MTEVFVVYGPPGYDGKEPILYVCSDENTARAAILRRLPESVRPSVRWLGGTCRLDDVLSCFVRLPRYERHTLLEPTPQTAEYLQSLGMAVTPDEIAKAAAV